MTTDQLLTVAKAKFEHAAAKKLLQEKYEAKMLFAWNGGMFRASPEMISWLSLYGDQEVVLPDLYHNPVKFRANEVLEIMKAKWQEQMNAWLIEYQELNQKR